MQPSSEIQKLPMRDYLANCIWHIQNSECHTSRQREREIDIADAIMIASESGLDHAHAYLVGISKAAKDGKYAHKI